MQTAVQVARTSSRSVWAGRILSGLVVLFFLFDSFGKLMKLAPVVAGTVELGFPQSTIRGIGVVLFVCTIAYVIPRTSVLGAILLTGYLGGAVAVQVRVGHPLIAYTLFPVYVGILVWLGLYLRIEQLRGLVPLRKAT
jgi:hypothetical protein